MKTQAKSRGGRDGFLKRYFAGLHRWRSSKKEYNWFNRPYKLVSHLGQVVQVQYIIDADAGAMQ